MGYPLLGARGRAGLGLAICFLAGCAQATPTPTLAATRAPSVSTATPLPSATQIEEPTEIAIDIASIHILAPGPDSLVTSPIELRAKLAPGADGLVRVELADARGRLLAVQVLPLAGGLLELHIPFELSRPSLPAQLTISTRDAYGRTRALNSVDLTLLASGAASIFPPAASEPIVIEQPQAGAELAGGSLLVRGRAQTQPGRPLTVQLVTREGRVLASREVYPRDGRFEVEFNLDLDEPAWVQVAIFEDSGVAPGAAHFAAVEVWMEKK